MNSPKKLTDADDRRFMKSALALARRGLGTVAPNPSVGCVIVSPEGRMIGRGWTQPGEDRTPKRKPSRGRGKQRTARPLTLRSNHAAIRGKHHHVVKH